jgi:hypothetical protein
MATRHTPDALARWLAAEQQGRDDEAEMALLELFEALPERAPESGFADRVMARWSTEGALAAPVDELAPVPVWMRWLLGGVLLALGSLPFWGPVVFAVVAALGSALGLPDLLQTGVRGLSSAGQGLTSLVGLWKALATAIQAVVPPLASPRVAGAVLACLAVSAISFRFLREILSRDRSWAYVDPS